MLPTCSIRGALRAASLLLFVAAPTGTLAVAQGLERDPTPPPGGDAVPGSYLVRFADPAVDRSPMRAAIRSGAGADAVAEIVTGFEAAARERRAAFVAAVEARGAQVTHLWWIVDGAAVADAGDGAWLADLPGVAAVEPDAYVHALNRVARNAAHHDADGANRRRNANGDLVTGTGVGVAVLDTGSDVDYGQTNLPHPAYFVGGDQSDRSGGGLRGSRLRAVLDASGNGVEDSNGHGAHVEGSVASDYAGYRGMAPGASIIGIRISGPGPVGWATSSALVNAWQMVAAERVRLGIAVANNSFSGSPDPGSSIQRALDNAAWFADVLPVCAAGNSRGDTSNSQNVWNGLAVGALVKNTLDLASFSATGPLDGFGRTFPDITAVGNGVDSIQLNSPSPIGLSGTSMASPMVAGGAALVRQAAPALSALETKALLLNTTKHVRNDRNRYGLGVLDCDAAVAQALAGDVHTMTLPGSGSYQRSWTAPTSGTFRLTVAWMHPAGRTFDDLDLTVRHGNNVVATDGNRLNSYEAVEFAVVAGRNYQLEVRRAGATVVRDLEFAIAGLPPLSSPNPPVLTAIQPARVTNAAREPIALVGTVDGIRAIDVGPHRITHFVQTAADRIEFSLPAPAEIAAAHPVTVTNAAGTSNALTLAVDGTHPAQLSGDSFGPKGSPTDLEIVGDAGWTSVLFLSPVAEPSVLQGIVDFGIGANFTQLYEMTYAVHDSRGYATFTPTIPPGTPLGFWWFQALTVDVTSLAPPVETSNVWRILSY